MSKAKYKAEFGDFQTPQDLARKVCALVASKEIAPASIVEPTCGVGNFLVAAVEQFPNCHRALGLDINEKYVECVREKLQDVIFTGTADVNTANFFDTNWFATLSTLPEPILVIGNPPWVTSAELSVLDSANLPRKANFHGHSGLEALTGKGNFDISEWMLLRFAECFDGRRGILAMLCKTSVARKVLTFSWKNSYQLCESAIYQIDAAAYFGAAVDACLLLCSFASSSRSRDAVVFASLETDEPDHIIGLRDSQLVADIGRYDRWNHLQGKPVYNWRSGIKHDCSRVMEFDCEDGCYRNGLGESVTLEESYIYPMAKGSDLAKGKFRQPRKWMLVTQETIASATEDIRLCAPQTWDYLQTQASHLDSRRSVIYRNRPRFSVFGVGAYSFAPWKVAVSGLHKSLKFTVIGPYQNKPVVLDDTCYFIPCEKNREAEYLASLLNSDTAQQFFRSFIFWDSKRPITADVLRHLDLMKLAKETGSESTFYELASRWANLNSTAQLSLFE